MAKNIFCVWRHWWRLRWTEGTFIHGSLPPSLAKILAKIGRALPQWFWDNCFAASCVFYMESPYFLVLTQDSTLHLPPLQIAPLEILATNGRSLTYTGVSLGSPERTEQILCEIHPGVFCKRGAIASSFSSPGLRLKALLSFERELRGSCHQYMPTCQFRVA